MAGRFVVEQCRRLAADGVGGSQLRNSKSSWRRGPNEHSERLVRLGFASLAIFCGHAPHAPVRTAQFPEETLVAIVLGGALLVLGELVEFVLMIHIDEMLSPRTLSEGEITQVCGVATDAMACRLEVCMLVLPYGLPVAREITPVSGGGPCGPAYPPPP